MVFGHSGWSFIEVRIYCWKSDHKSTGENDWPRKMESGKYLTKDAFKTVDFIIMDLIWSFKKLSMKILNLG